MREQCKSYRSGKKIDDPRSNSGSKYCIHILTNDFFSSFGQNSRLSHTSIWWQSAEEKKNSGIQNCQREIAPTSFRRSHVNLQIIKIESESVNSHGRHSLKRS